MSGWGSSGERRVVRKERRNGLKEEKWRIFLDKFIVDERMSGVDLGCTE